MPQLVRSDRWYVVYDHAVGWWTVLSGPTLLTDHVFEIDTATTRGAPSEYTVFTTALDVVHDHNRALAIQRHIPEPVLVQVTPRYAPLPSTTGWWHGLLAWVRRLWTATPPPAVGVRWEASYTAVLTEAGTGWTHERTETVVFTAPDNYAAALARATQLAGDTEATMIFYHDDMREPPVGSVVTLTIHPPRREA